MNEVKLIISFKKTTRGITIEWFILLIVHYSVERLVNLPSLFLLYLTCLFLITENW